MVLIGSIIDRGNVDSKGALASIRSGLWAWVGHDARTCRSLAISTSGDQPLLQDAPERTAPKHLSVTAASVTLSQNIVGSGLLCLPYAMKSAGWAAGLLLLVIMWAITIGSMALCAIIAAKTKRYTLDSQALELFGPKGKTLIGAWSMVYTFGLCCAYPILLGDFLQQLMVDMGVEGTSPAGCMALVMCTVCYPLSCVPSLGSLSCASFLGVSGILLCAFSAFLRYFDGTYDGPEYKTNDVTALNLATLGDCFPILVSALGAHFNVPLLFREVAGLPVETHCASETGQPYDETREGKAAIRRMYLVIFIAVTLSSVLYGGVGMVVYCTFGPDTSSDFSNNFRTNDQLVTLVRAMMLVSICATLPLVMFSTRQSAFNLLLAPRGFKMDAKVRISLATVLVGFCLFVAEAVGDIGIVLDYNGSLAGTPTCYVMPMLLYMALPSAEQTPGWRRFSQSCAVLGAAFGMFGTSVVTSQLLAATTPKS